MMICYNYSLAVRIFVVPVAMGATLFVYAVKLRSAFSFTITALHTIVMIKEGSCNARL